MAKNQKIKIAAVQFPVTGDIAGNGKYIRRFIREAAAKRATIIQFPETALSGWGKWTDPKFQKYDFAALRRETSAIQKLAAEKRVWVILGSVHRLGSDFKPTNCLYVIDPGGKIADRYDKCWLTHTGSERELFTPGNRLTTFSLGGVRCGLMICYDSNFLQMFNAYARKGVRILFLSMGHAGFKGDYARIEKAWVALAAMTYGFWIVVSNSASRYSGLETCVGNPNGMGSIAKTLKRHQTGVLYYDLAPSSFRNDWKCSVPLPKLHPREVFHNGKPSRHPRALNRRALP